MDNHYNYPILSNIPMALQNRNQWVCWIASPDAPGKKAKKLPVNPRTGNLAISSNRLTWGTWEDAVAFYKKYEGQNYITANGKFKGVMNGIGFVLAAQDDIVGVDLDDCITPDGSMEEWANEIIGALDSYTEISPSGNGVHIFVQGKKPGSKSRKGNIEIYSENRFLTLTGVYPKNFEAKEIANNQPGIEAVYNKYIASDSTQPDVVIVSEKNIDNALVNAIMASSDSEKFNRLMEGDCSSYPSQSEADLALCSILARHTDNNPDAIDEAFRQSRLYRDKWDAKHGDKTYGELTIEKAIDGNMCPSSRKNNKNDTQTYMSLPPKVPLDVFPEQVQQLLMEAAGAFGVPLEIPVTSLLALVSCLVGRSRLIKIKDGWLEAGNIWIVIVAQSGMGKSPCMKEFFKGVYKLEAQSKKKYDDQMREYQLKDKIYQQTVKQSKQTVPVPCNCMPPQKPSWRQAIADDTTPEALGNMLQDNSKGVMWVTDELATLICNMDRYTQKQDGTKSRLLSAHDCGPWKTNRISKDDRNTFISHACVGIFGGVQPGRLPHIFDSGQGRQDEESGFLQRFIFIRAIAEKPNYFSDAALSTESKSLMSKITESLWVWDVNAASDTGNIVEVSAEAKVLYGKWYDKIATLAFNTENGSRLKKLQAHALRICLLLHSLEIAIGNAESDSMVSGSVMERALKLADWINVHQEQCWQLFGGAAKCKQLTGLQLAIARAIVDNAPQIIKQGYIIQTSSLTKLVSTSLGNDTSSVAVGKAAKSMNLETIKIAGARGYRITSQQLDEFKSVLSVQSEVSPCSSNSCEGYGDAAFCHQSVPVCPASAGNMFQDKCLTHIATGSLTDITAKLQSLPQEMRDNYNEMVKAMFSVLSMDRWKTDNRQNI